MSYRVSGYKKILLAAALSIIALTLAASLALAASEDDIDQKIKQQESEYNKIQRQISSNKRKLSETTRKEKDVTKQIEVLSQKITLTQQRVNVVNLKVKRLHGNIAKLTKDIWNAEKRISYIQDILSTRLVSMYKYGGVAEFNLLLSANGAQEALSTSYLLSKMAERDQALIKDLFEQKRSLQEIKTKLNTERSNYEKQGVILKGQKKELNAAADDRNALLSKVRKDKALYMAEQAELLRASKELQATVKKLLAEKRRINAARNPGKKETVYYKGGRLQWPAQGSISSTFGTRIHPVFKTKITHTGLDISAPKGTPVVAADSGEVLYTGWMRGYGQVIIVDHGANLTTVYAHLSQIECKEGAKVSRGATIGRVGSTGVATGNHLHFEVRVNGDAVDPMRYLR
ncbi:MAG: peptidoglycan DD-metalloendopeptidase family protein [Synergistaceae bacterium]|nr:peptidoglycan DD-metalloendopeptidase family protein [Synergistaceae bacterium]